MGEVMKKLVVGILALGALVLAGCSTDADVASRNLSTAADQFEVDRRVVFFNGITDKYLLSIEGKCSIEDANRQLEVTCKTGPDQYKKHFLGLSDNVSYFTEQLEGISVDTFHYRVIFKPEAIIPDVDRP
jgi:predicted small secreted protein